MNQGFKLRFDQLRESDPTGLPSDMTEDDVERYPVAGHTRNLCLVWPDGKQAFFNYAYLIEAEFDPGSDKNSIVLNFSAYRVTLRGYGLDTLFAALLAHLPRVIMVIEARYALNSDGKKETVVEAFAEKAD